jgi:hypothetical protein
MPYSKYHKWYYSFVNKAILENRRKYEGTYFENHHIQPRCMGGSEDPSNLVLLTAREHFIAHLLLVKMYPGNVKLLFAFSAMSMVSKNNEQRYHSRNFSKTRENVANAVGNLHRGKNMSAEVRAKISAGLKNRTVSLQTKEAIRRANQNRVVSEDTRRFISKKNTGRRFVRDKPFSSEHRAKLAEAKHGSANNAQLWSIATPDGSIIVTSDRRKFCEDHGLNFDSVKATRGIKHKGYLFTRLPKPPPLISRLLSG